MTWTILIRTVAPHYEFWSAQESRSGYTGQILYGRIGTGGTSHSYSPDEVGEKIRLKLREGYVIFRSGSITEIPTTFQVQEFLTGLVQWRSVERSNRHQEREEEETPEHIPHPRVRHSVPNAPISKEYETDRTGQLKKYPFTRPETGNIFAQYSFNKVREMPDSRIFMQYFTTIPLELRHGIREFGESGRTGTIRGAEETFFAVFRLSHGQNKIVGVYSVNTQTGKCSTFYVKSNEEKRITVLKYMLRALSMSTQSGSINFTYLNAPMKREILRDILGTAQETLSQQQLYGSVGLSGIRMVNAW